MLTTLRIKNLALVEDLTVEFRPGYNAITGETGAGKSIVIGALGLVLGERADRALLRSGCESCTVEATFDVGGLRQPLPAFLEENGLEPCEGGQLVLKRSFTAAGANRQFVNGSATALQTLAHLGDWLVDIHGPHDHQSLFHPARQLELVDAHAGLEPDRERFAELVRQQRDCLSQKAALIVDEATYARQLDLLRHQVREIGAARLQPGEEESLQREHERATNAHRLLELSQKGLALLADEETSLLSQSGALGRVLQELQRLDTEATAIRDLHAQATATLTDLLADLRHYADRIEVDPAHLQALDERVNSIHTLKRKYGPTLAAVLEFAERAGAELAQLESRDEHLAALNALLESLQAQWSPLGAELTARRQKAVPRLARVGCEEKLDFVEA